MKPIPAIVENDIARAASAVDAALRNLREAQQHETAAEGRLNSARNVTARMRLELGRALAAARPCWPLTGPKAKGWTDFLKVRAIDPDVASDAMKYAGYVEKRFSGTLPEILPTRREAGIVDRDVKPENTPRAPLALVPDAEPEVEIDRDTWCTPKWITEAIGRWDLDPCSNERSTVQARHVFRLDEGALEDGLHPPSVIDDDMRVFVNPPYSDVAPWIAAYARTRFCFLLKLDTSTRWFAELYARTELILIPRKRVQFDPPPGVPPEKAHAQQFPHALFYARAADATPEIRALCWAWRVEHEQPATDVNNSPEI